MQCAEKPQANRLVIGKRSLAAEMVGKPDFPLGFSRRYKACQCLAGKRIIVDRCQLDMAGAFQCHDCILMNFPGLSGFTTNHADLPCGSLPMRAPGTGGLEALSTVAALSLPLGRNPASCNSITDSL